MSGTGKIVRVFDELINGAKILRGEGSNESNNTKDENVEECVHHNW